MRSTLTHKQVHASTAEVDRTGEGWVDSYYEQYSYSRVRNYYLPCQQGPNWLNVHRVIHMCKVTDEVVFDEEVTDHLVRRNPAKVVHHGDGQHVHREGGMAVRRGAGSRPGHGVLLTRNQVAGRRRAERLTERESKPSDVSLSPQTCLIVWLSFTFPYAPLHVHCTSAAVHSD